MTRYEREKVLLAVSAIDGGCTCCIKDTLKRLELLFPDEPFVEEFGIEAEWGEWREKMLSLEDSLQ